MLGLFLLLAAIDVTPPRPSVITQPQWLSKPTGPEFQALYPKAAAAKGIEGRAVIRCSINSSGLLVGCQVIEETPPGEEFGNAALVMSGKFRMKPMTRDGVPVAGGTVMIPIIFRLPPPAIPPYEVASRCYGYAAAEAERNPRSQVAQVGTFAFRVLIEARASPQQLRPSEVEKQLESLQASASPKLDDPKFASERNACTAMLGSNPVAAFQRLIGQPGH